MPELNQTGHADIGEGHKMQFDLDYNHHFCTVCGLKSPEDNALLEQDCVRAGEEAPKDRFELIQEKVSEGMAKVEASVKQKWLEMMKVGPGMDEQVQAKMLVVETFNQLRDVTDSEPLKFDDVYVVWFSYTLGNWKALLSTTVSDGRYYEVTHNEGFQTSYVDTYVKLNNREVKDEDFFERYNTASES